jgi:hypothetical protein
VPPRSGIWRPRQWRLSGAHCAGGSLNKRSDRVSPLQTIIFSSFTGRTPVTLSETCLISSLESTNNSGQVSGTSDASKTQSRLIRSYALGFVFSGTSGYLVPVGIILRLIRGSTALRSHRLLNPRPVRYSVVFRACPRWQLPGRPLRRNSQVFRRT